MEETESVRDDDVSGKMMDSSEDIDDVIRLHNRAVISAGLCDESLYLIQAGGEVSSTIS